MDRGMDYSTTPSPALPAFPSSSPTTPKLLADESARVENLHEIRSACAAHIYDVRLPRRVKHFDEGHGSFHDLAVSFASSDAFPPRSFLRVPPPPPSPPRFLRSRQEHFDRLQYECVSRELRDETRPSSEIDIKIEGREMLL